MKGGGNVTDTNELNLEIKKSGKTKKFLAEKCGLTYAGFHNCCTNKAEFKVSHVDILCEELNIKSLKRRMDIFFAKHGS